MGELGIAASYYEKLSGRRVQCHLCPHECLLAPNTRGRCRARKNMDGVLMALSYGKATAIDLDPMEKKPLYHFLPGEQVLSFGSWGCNLRCDYCQNFTISQQEHPAREIGPNDPARLMRDNRVRSVAFTYNEPLISFEFVRDAAREVRRTGGRVVLVTNGFVNPDPWDELLGFVDAVNIDVKAFEEDFYREHCGGTLEPVLDAVEQAVARKVHVELTTLVIPSLNDAPKPMEDLAIWIADKCGKLTPLHLSAYFPRYRSTIGPTPAVLIERLRDIFRKRLQYVYIGNAQVSEGSDTFCRQCGATVIRRIGFVPDLTGMTADGRCKNCGADNGIVVR